MKQHAVFFYCYHHWRFFGLQILFFFFAIIFAAFFITLYAACKIHLNILRQSCCELLLSDEASKLRGHSMVVGLQLKFRTILRFFYYKI
jgi:hypothetical protein